MAADGQYQPHDWGNMEGEELIALRWNNHISSLSQLLYSLREEETLVDATLACEGRLFPAHKFVLSMCSDYFKEMFSSNPCKHPIVFLKDVRCEDMEALLDFMYRGVVHIPKEALNSLLKTAEGLQIRGLGLFAKETGEGNLSHTPDDSRIMEPSVLMSPDRKRPYVMDHSDGFTFTDGEVDAEGTLHTPIKRKYDRYDGPPAPTPELPMVDDDTLDLGGGINIPTEDYFKLRRNNPNRYINDLLRYFFPMEVLINSSLTGTECFANKNKDRVNPVIKNQLDPNIIKVITIDAIRNFPVIDEKQVRNAIRRKLQTETRIYRSQEKISTPGVRRNGGPKRKQMPIGDSPRAMVSIEKSERKKEEHLQSMDMSHTNTSELPMEKTEDAHQDSLQDVHENVHERIHENINSSSYPSPHHDFTEKTASTVQQREQEQSQQQQQQQQQRSSSSTPTPQHSNFSAHHTSVPSTSASSPVASSSHSSLDLKTFKPHENIVKSEIPSSAQYLPQEYSYPSMMAPHVGQAYLPHHMAATDPSYLRRLEMTQGAALAHPYSYLPTSEPSLHM